MSEFEAQKEQAMAETAIKIGDKVMCFRRSSDWRISNGVVVAIKGGKAKVEWIDGSSWIDLRRLTIRNAR